jgi:dolichol-phosphate mannosyltransferase
MKSLKLDEAGYAFPMQLWPRAAAARLRVKEIPVRLIYNDPNRYFGGMLDDAGIRLAHYLEVFHRELTWQPAPESESELGTAASEAACPCCCPE